MTATHHTITDRCFLPDLTGLGIVQSHGTWLPNIPQNWTAKIHPSASDNKELYNSTYLGPLTPSPFGYAERYAVPRGRGEQGI